MRRGCDECHTCRSAISVYRCGLEASVRLAACCNTAEAWGKVASLKAQLWRLEDLWATHRLEAHGLLTQTSTR
jgi:hypothetical protein